MAHAKRLLEHRAISESASNGLKYWRVLRFSKAQLYVPALSGSCLNRQFRVFPALLRALSEGPMGEESPESAAKGAVHNHIKIFTLTYPTLWTLSHFSGLSKEVIGTCCTLTSCTMQKQ